MRLIIVIVLAMALFSSMFVVQNIGPFDFWWWMSSNLVIIIGLSALLYQDYLPGILKDFSNKIYRKILLGVVSAVMLYLVFLSGNYISGFIIPNASSEIAGIYDFKGDAGNFRIFTLMLLIIGPGEEIFWRGFLQHRLSEKLNPVGGFAVATVLYTLVHVFTGNFMLIMAAMVAGVFWGWMYLKFRSVSANIISHVLWDIAIFLIIPIS